MIFSNYKFEIFFNTQVVNYSLRRIKTNNIYSNNIRDKRKNLIIKYFLNIL